MAFAVKIEQSFMSGLFTLVGSSVVRRIFCVLDGTDSFRLEDVMLRAELVA